MAYYESAHKPARSKKRKKRLSAYEVSQIIVEREIKTLTELQALACEQKNEGKTDVVEFLITHNPRVVSDILNSAWEIENAPAKLSRSRKTSLEILQEEKEGRCVAGCNGERITCAQEILENNRIPMVTFSEAVRDLLQRGRGKYRNVMIVGPANCGKSFLLNPLIAVYHTFCNPASGSFTWIGVENVYS